MATGVAPRDDDLQLSRIDLEAIQDAMKQKKFRDMFKDYFDEIRDPANQAIFQKEMTQLEKERGYDVTFINPKGGYVIKTSVAGDKKAFINICSNDNVGKPSCSAQDVEGKRGMNWQIPYSLFPPREDYTAKHERVVLYDVVFHPDTLRMAEVNKQFRELVNKTAFEGLAKTYNIHLDNNNCRFPKSEYKGMAVPAVIRTEDPNYAPPTFEETENLSPEILEKLYPQRTYDQSNAPSCDFPSSDPKQTQFKAPAETKPESSSAPSQQRRKVRRGPSEFTHATDNGYTIPKYVIKQQKTVDLQDYTYNKDCKQHSAIPSHIVVEVNMPLLSSTKDCILDVQEKALSLKSEKPAKYKLNITLPYPVNDECGNAKFDKSKHKLIVTLPVIKKNIPSASSHDSNSLKVDSGVESEENSGSQSEEENTRENLVVELSSSPADPSVDLPGKPEPKVETFFNPSLGFILPSYTHNVMDDIVAFTFHVKNTEPDSVNVKKDGNKIFIRFTSVGSSFVPVHYGAIIVFDESVNFENITGEAWDNNVILQLELAGEAPQKFQIGLSEETMTFEELDMSQVKKNCKIEIKEKSASQEDTSGPVVEVTNLGTETNIVVSSTTSEYDEDDDLDSPTAKDEEIVWTDPGPVSSEAKSILRKPDMLRSYSESSVGDVASSIDYMSSDCIPEDSSFKKTVRFSDVIARQFYRYNSSIEGQKKKNQRKKSKKRSQEQRKSESEAEDDASNLPKVSKSGLKSVLKPRRDSGLADTSDAEADCRDMPLEYQSSVDIEKDKSIDENVKHSAKTENENSTDDNEKSILYIVDDNGNSKENSVNENVKHSAETEPTIENDTENKEISVLNIVDKNGNDKEKSEPIIWESEALDSKPSNFKDNEKSDPLTCENIKHNTELYNPERLNKGQYLEVTFKNDLIFDLDM